MNAKAAAKRRWSTQRNAKANQLRGYRKDFRANTVRVKTPWGLLITKPNPIFHQDRGLNCPKPGFYRSHEDYIAANPAIAST